MKQETLKKRDELSQTGSEAKEYTPLEEAVLDALGKDSARVEGLAVAEQWDNQEASRGSSRQSK